MRDESVVTTAQLTTALSEMFPLEILGVTVAPKGTSETETVSALPSASLAVPTVATVAVGLPRTTVMLPVILTDGAVFVSNADKNPTLTIMALAWRSADHILDMMRRKEL